MFIVTLSPPPCSLVVIWNHQSVPHLYTMPLQNIFGGIMLWGTALFTSKSGMSATQRKLWRGGLKENDPHRLVHVDAWSSVGSTIWGSMWSCWRCDTRVELWCFKSQDRPSLSVCLLLVHWIQALSYCSKPYLPPCLMPCSPPWWSQVLPSGTMSPQIKCFPSCLSHGVSSQQ